MANASSASNPYQRTAETILAAPVGFRQRLRFLGPGFILSASIVGSGELIATTRLGAEAGFVTFWVILVSCLVKVTVQLEFGRQAIYSGETTMAYNYWLIEKGYAAHAGPREENEAWRHRARGWIRVMYLDALLAMVVYTAMTAAFYLLGAAILHRQALMPEGMALVETLSRLYTQSLGPWAGTLFLAGAFVVLFSTLFGALAIWTRLFSDAFGQIGWLDFKDVAQRHRAIAVLAWSFPLIWATLFLVLKVPALMVIIGGVATTVILLIVVFAALHFRYRRVPEALRPGTVYDAALWISVLAILMVALYGIFQLL